MSRNLIIYFSRKGQNYVGGKIVSLAKGNAERIAEFISDAVNGDLFEIKPVKEYPEDYNACTEEAKEELRANERPAIEEHLGDDDLREYDNIFVVGPCWWGTYPMAMFTQLEELDFRGKKVFPVMTHEGSGLGSAERDLKKMCAGAKVKRGLAVQGSMIESAEQTIRNWAIKSAK